MGFYGEIQSLVDLLPDFSPYRYTHGGCYLYAKIISMVLPGSKVYLSKRGAHCAVYYKGYLYDADGKIAYDTSKYRPLSNDFLDDIYCLEHFHSECTPKQDINFISEIVNKYVELFKSTYAITNLMVFFKQLEKYYCTNFQPENA